MFFRAILLSSAGTQHDATRAQTAVLWMDRFASILNFIMFDFPVVGETE
jgi:hypothetical protein